MTLREQTKQPTHFLVKYTEDSVFQVRSRAFIECEGRVKVSALYEVRYGNTNEEVATALVMYSGTEADMRAKMKEHNTTPASETTLVPTTEPTSAPKTQQKSANQKAAKPKAVVRSRTILKLPPTPAARTAPPSPRSPTPPPLHAPLSPEITVLNALINHSDEYFLPAVENIRPASPIIEDRQLLDMSLGVDNDTLLTPKSQQQRLYQNLGRKIDKINQNLNTLSQEQTAMKTQFIQFSTSMYDQMTTLTTLVQQLIIQGQPPAAPENHLAPPALPAAPPALPVALPAAPETFLDIPEPHRISLADLHRFKDHSHNPGHLSVLLTQRLFPELFGDDCLCRQYSYYGAGKLNKTPLNAEKKTYLQRYVLFLYPELQEDRKWKDTVVCRVNEVLRRPAK